MLSCLHLEENVHYTWKKKYIKLHILPIIVSSTWCPLQNRINYYKRSSTMKIPDTRITKDINSGTVTRWSVKRSMYYNIKHPVHLHL